MTKYVDCDSTVSSFILPKPLFESQRNSLFLLTYAINMEVIEPEQFDVIVIGSGLPESLIGR